MNRRDFVHAAGSAALIVRLRPLAAQQARFDLVIKGGRVIDPSLRLDAVRDVGIAGGRIAAIEPTLDGDAAATLEARGKLVVPGLIDIHTHAARDMAGPGMLLRDGVTGWIDAGSAGADGIDAVVADRARVAATGPHPAQHRPRRHHPRRRHEGLGAGRRRRGARGDRAASRVRRRYQGAARRKPSSERQRRRSVERAAVVAAGELPVMIHMGQSASSLRELLPLLRSRRHRDAPIRAAAARDPRRQRPHSARGACGASARHRVRRRQRRPRPHALGYGRANHGRGLLARHVSPPTGTS